MTTYSLLELNTFLRQVVTLNFPEPVWITAEIAQVSPARGGHLFLELVQKGSEPEEPIVAQAGAVLWRRQYQQLPSAQQAALDELLREGREVRLCVRVDFHERYGIKLFVLDADPVYTIGRLALQRRQALQQLRQEGLLERNRSLPLPAVLQRVAVLSSEGAAGLADFQEHLRQNPFGYAFLCRLFSTAVQGEYLESDFLDALDQVRRQAHLFDCAVVLRGGGARLDLSGFDRLSVCRAAAQLPIPLFTGIGHESDETLLDQVAFAALKTPTAVADFLIQHNALFENALLQQHEYIREHAYRHLNHRQLALAHGAAVIRWAAQAHLRQAHQQLSALDAALPRLQREYLHRMYDRLERDETLCNAFHPDVALRRGFSLTRKNGRILTSTQAVQPGDIIETQLADGRFQAHVTGRD
jgi:exodeoxyribonuclease VII large subunit